MKCSNSIIAIISLLVLSFFSSCDKRPEGVLSESEMVDLLTDLQLAEAYYSTNMTGNGSIDRRSLEESVLKKHGVSREELEATIKYYARNIDDYSKLYDKVEKKLRAQSGTAHSEGQTSADDIWPYGRFAVFMPNQMSEGLTFSIPAEDIEPGNSLEWGMRLTSADGVEIMLGVEYEDGSSTLLKKSASGNPSLQVNLQTDTALNAKRIFGVMNVPKNKMPVWTDSIRLVKTPYDSMEYSKIKTQKLIRKPVKKSELPIMKKETPEPDEAGSVNTTVDTLMARPTLIKNV